MLAATILPEITRKFWGNAEAQAGRKGDESGVGASQQFEAGKETNPTRSNKGKRMQKIMQDLAFGRFKSTETTNKQRSSSTVPESLVSLRNCSEMLDNTTSPPRKKDL